MDLRRPTDLTGCQRSAFGRALTGPSLSRRRQRPYRESGQTAGEMKISTFTRKPRFHSSVRVVGLFPM